MAGEPLKKHQPKPWTPDSWKNSPAKQLPEYDNPAELEAVEKTLGNYPPLVFAGEARRLKDGLAKVARGEAFLSFTQKIFVTPSAFFCKWRS
jgi:3-deoxy-D-arabino-heptulosonate 7-phosphate (DAHP) synthase class II